MKIGSERIDFAKRSSNTSGSKMGQREGDIPKQFFLAGVGADIWCFLVAESCQAVPLLLSLVGFGEL